MTPPISETLPDHENGSTVIAKIENLQSVYKKNLDYHEAAATKAREAEHLSSIKLHRQGELLEDALKAADAALKENNDLRLRLDSLGKGMRDLSDEEANQMTSQLYDDLEDWIKRHYGTLQPGNPEKGPDVDSHQEQELFFNIYEDISQQIFHIILSRFVVGTGNPGMNHALRMLDEKNNEDPRDIGQYWRAGTSSAALALARPELEVTLSQIVEFIEARYLHTMPHDFATRSGELKELLWRFVKWKGRLECQSVLFYFWWVSPRLPFRTEIMTNLTGDDDPDAIVHRSLSPILYKLIPGDSEPTLVHRALVQITSDPLISVDLGKRTRERNASN
ncbi:uncharacterized protein N7484_010192 [Penicillium longicatenatum]|uniref:uncharacterized protein n=1 Tax=Penicillium longicatenatum TaxID=1561947 RepID=UPI0025483A1B|nr:uncharacterized protein N7484_010192 [Penicillium longicatenatum]KAJ5636879.1 hypothetical protein N7484_010192 [Penicillium longicatenatum]